MPATICFVSHSSGAGGAEQVLFETIETLKARGVECRVLVPEWGELCARLDLLGVPFHIISFPMWMSRGRVGPFARLKAAVGTLVNSVSVMWRISRWKCDVVYSNTVTVCVGALAARFLGLPHVWHLHEFGMEDQGLSFLFGERLSLAVVSNFSDCCICVSQALAIKYQRSVPAEKIFVVYPSMQQVLGCEGECRDDEESGDEGFRCVIAGSLMEGKGQEDSVLAMAHLRKSGVNVELVIVGDGIPSYRHRLEQSVMAHGLDSRVRFIGHVRNAFSFMKNADVVLVCSKSEAFGRVTIEGMFAGKPIIGARSGATAELIQDGVTGLLYKQGDPSDLASKIEYLFNNRTRAVDLGRNARSWVQTCFTQERYTREIMDALNSLSLPTAKTWGPAPVA